VRESRDQDSKNRGVGEGEILTRVGNNLLQKFADPLLSRTATLCSPALSLPHATLGPYQFTQSDPLHTFDTGSPYSLGANQRVPWIAAPDTATTRRPWPVRRRCPPSSPGWSRHDSRPRSTGDRCSASRTTAGTDQRSAIVCRSYGCQVALPASHLCPPLLCLVKKCSAIHPLPPCFFS
jgi:hypothetical protein